MSTARKGPLNWTTEVEAVKTAAEVVALLAGNGATHIGQEYDGGKPVSITFVLKTEIGPRPYRLPVNVGGMYEALRKARLTGAIPPRYASREQAERVAWRVAKMWLETQLALMQAHMVSIAQVMLPYELVDEDRTVWDIRLEQGLKSLEAGTP